MYLKLVKFSLYLIPYPCRRNPQMTFTIENDRKQEYLYNVSSENGFKDSNVIWDIL